ncbi:unnamed protein product [Prorocentrum cordatum]|uniref:EF-hand domain-containing protein n=1 Tax=Prorocentrum cordatum TaxID=2364126 RepID=A0ABN9WDR2_9DINO|nr:unnamed protein product [Polarella glacialis]
MDAFLRSEIQVAFQEALSTKRDPGAATNRSLSPKVLVDHFPQRPGPSRDTITNGDYDAPHWGLTSLRAFVASNAKKKGDDDQDAEELWRRPQAGGGKLHLAPPHYSQQSSGGGRASLRERSTEANNDSVFFGPNASVHIQKNPKIRRGSTRGSRGAGQSLYMGRVSMAIAKADEKKPSFAEWARSLTRLETYRGMSAAAILGSFRNPITIGMEADYAAQNVTDTAPITYRVFEVFFCIVFTTELVLRVYVYKLEFFLKREVGVLWNYFDLLVVTAQLVQECFEYIQSSANGNNDAGNLRILRILRVLRIVRIFRLVRVLHLISEFRAIVSSIIGSFRSLCWAVLLLLLMMYIVGVWFLQTVTDLFITRAAFDGDGVLIPFSSGEESLKGHFGSLGWAILSLDVGDPLMNEIDWFLGLAFAAFIAFSLLALMSVVTGVFVQTALHSAERKEENFLTDKDLDENLEDPEIAKEWKNINVSADEAKYVFALFDVEESGEVQFEEFVSACSRLKGNAKSLDLPIQLQEPPAPPPQPAASPDPQPAPAVAPQPEPAPAQGPAAAAAPAPTAPVQRLVSRRRGDDPSAGIQG